MEFCPELSEGQSINNKQIQISMDGEISHPQLCSNNPTSIETSLCLTDWTATWYHPKQLINVIKHKGRLIILAKTYFNYDAMFATSQIWPVTWELKWPITLALSSYKPRQVCLLDLVHYVILYTTFLQPFASCSYTFSSPQHVWPLVTIFSHLHK